MVCLLLYQSAVGPQNLHGEKHKSSYLDLAVCGLNAGLWGGSQAAAVREAWRLCLFGVLSPLGRLVESELRASDLSGRARAFQSMVGGTSALPHDRRVRNVSPGNPTRSRCKVRSGQHLRLPH